MGRVSKWSTRTGNSIQPHYVFQHRSKPWRVSQCHQHHWLYWTQSNTIFQAVLCLLLLDAAWCGAPWLVWCAIRFTSKLCRSWIRPGPRVDPKDTDFLQTLPVCQCSLDFWSVKALNYNSSNHFDLQKLYVVVATAPFKMLNGGASQLLGFIVWVELWINELASKC